MSRLERIKRTSFDELRVRGVQAINMFAERRGWSPLAKLPTDASFLKLLKQSNAPQKVESAADNLQLFRSRKQPNFFAGVADRENDVAELRRRWPAAEKGILEKANRILAGSFDLLGLRGLNFGDPIDWQLEPASGKRALPAHWSRLNYLDADLIGDKKIVWELNGHQYFTTLGQPYWLTADELFAAGFGAHLNNWMTQTHR